MIHLLVKNDGVYLIQEMPVEPKRPNLWGGLHQDDIDHADKMQAEYIDAIDKAPKIFVSDQDQAKELIISHNGHPLDKDFPKIDRAYPVSGWRYEIVSMDIADPIAILIEDPTPSNSGELKLTPEQVKEREEAINWYRGKPDSSEKPDFEAIANIKCPPKAYPEAWGGFTAACDYVWENHVLPLQSELTTATALLLDSVDKPKYIEALNEIDKLREENALLKERLSYIVTESFDLAKCGYIHNYPSNLNNKHLAILAMMREVISGNPCSIEEIKNWLH
jgi:hypothetical protein